MQLNMVLIVQQYVDYTLAVSIDGIVFKMHAIQSILICQVATTLPYRWQRLQAS